MADWRQIQARIRKAKNSADAPAKLSELYERTRDAMVAWELGTIEEKAERKDEAGNWYTIAAQRFRRADWKKKAEEALTRLGLELPPPQEIKLVERTAEVVETPADDSEETHQMLAPGEIPADESEDELSSEGNSATPAPQTSTPGDPARKKRRRGRRGGRGRRRKGAPASPGLPTQAFAASAAEPHRVQPVVRPPFERPVHVAAEPEPQRAAAVPRTRIIEEPIPPQLPSERTAHGRAGDPALASRMSKLESMLRRLVASPLHRLDEAEEAPAGPGVFLLSDSDQITSYYVEACQTLRIGCGNIARGGRSGKGTRTGRGHSESGLKERLAEYLGINEAKVAQYMKEHCVIRWIQMDEDAPLLAHFAIGVLRTPLNLD